MSKPPLSRYRNKILSRLAADDLALLEPYLAPVELPLRRSLESRGREIEHAYFIETGIASVVANSQSTRSIEVGLIGCEGVSATATLLHGERSPHDTFMQVSGSGYRLGVKDLLAAVRQSETLRTWLLKYIHVFMVQVAQTAFANGRGKIDERLARWLLMAHDRVGADDLSLTHEFLAMMLGVRRPGVTMALNQLEQEELISTHRRIITIRNRAALEKRADGVYGAPEAEFRRLFG